MNPIRCWLVLILLQTPLATQAQEKPGQTDETVRFFQDEQIHELRLRTSGDVEQNLRDEPRNYARCSVVEDTDTVFKSVGVKLKGAAGSYQEFDERPGFTLNFEKYKKGQHFHGMEKLHLNNAAQDESLLSEWLGNAIFREAGLAAPYVSHVRLWINDRDMGIYILREAFDRPFLRRTFGNTSGNLYDGGFVQDIDAELEMDLGKDPDDRTDLTGLAAACFHSNFEARSDQIAARLDVDQFLSFMAVERLCGHWDGYSLNMNNYRIYFPRKEKAVFLPHGMDQLFGDPGAGLYDRAPPLLAAAVLQNDQWRLRYSMRLKELATVLQPTEKWTARIEARQKLLRTTIEGIDENQAIAHSERVKELSDRFVERVAALPDLIDNGMPEPNELDEHGEVMSLEWSPQEEAEGAKLEEVERKDVAAYSITREPYGDFSSSWRSNVLLKRGIYRFQARVSTENVIPIPDDQGLGAGIRRSRSGRSNEMSGTTDWTLVTYEFDVHEDQRNVELILELRARHGTAWFDRNSLMLHRLP